MSANLLPRTEPDGARADPFVRRIWPWLPAAWGGLCLASWGFSVEASWWAAESIAILFFVGLLAGWAPRLRSAVDWPLMAISAWLPVNYLVSVDRSLSLPAASILLFGIGLYYLLRAIADAGWTRWPANLLTGLGLLLPWAILFTSSRPMALFSSSPGLAALSRRLPDLINANVLAGALAPIVPVSVTMILAPGKRLRRAIGVVSTLLALGAIIASGSRGAWLGLGAGLVCSAFLLGRWWSLFGALGLLGGSFAIWRVGLTRFAELLGKGSLVDSLAARGQIWARAFWALQDFLYTGIGIGAFPAVAPRLYPFFSFSDAEPIPHAHNLLLQVGIDLGLPGLLAFVAAMALALISGARAARRAPDPWVRLIAAGAAGALVAVLVHGIVDATLWGTQPAPLLWWLVAVNLICARQTGEGR